MKKLGRAMVAVVLVGACAAVWACSSSSELPSPLADGGIASVGDGGAAVEATVTQTIGTAGGALEVDGVVVTIPAGALTSDTQLRLTVGASALVTVSPDVSFATSATVKMDGVRWPAIGPRFAQHKTSGEFYGVGPVRENPDGSWEYDTTEFSSTRGLLLEVPTADLYVEGDCSNSTVEASQTMNPPGITRTDVTKSCLKDMSADIGAMHDPVTGPNAPERGGKRAADEYNWMTEEASVGLLAARVEVRAQLPGYDLWVNGAWDSSGGGVHGGNSNHYYGAALDLALCKSPCSGPASKVTTPTLLGQLPHILLTKGRFTWVWYEDSAHIHASISSPSLKDCRCPGTTGPDTTKPCPCGQNQFCKAGRCFDDLSGTYESTYDPNAKNCNGQGEGSCFCNATGVRCDGNVRHATITIADGPDGTTIGFGVCAGGASGAAICRHNNEVVFGYSAFPDVTDHISFSPSGLTGHEEGIKCGDGSGTTITFEVPKK